MTSAFRNILTVIAVCFAALAPGHAFAQTTVTADWTNLGKTSLEVVNDGEVLDLGINSVTINQTIVTDGDANDGDFTNFYSTGMMSYYAGQVSSHTGPLLYSMDHSVFDVGDFFETTFTLDTAVTELEFTVGNVDTFFGNVNFHDGIVIHYDTGDGTWRNLRNLAGATSLGSAVGTATIGGVAGWDGSNYSGGITSTTGDIAVDFGTTTVERVRIRYMFGQDNPGSTPSGNWQYIGISDFVWQQPNVDTADLSVTKLVSNPTPANGTALFYTLRVTNDGPDTSTNVEVRDIMPVGFDLTSTSGYGTYDEASGTWTLPSIASGQTREIILNGTVTAPNGVTVTNTAEVFATPDTFDPDSTPGNNQAGEDDLQTVSFTVQGTRVAGTAPTLFCPAGSTLHDWDVEAWPAGSLTNSYNLTGLGTVTHTLTSQGVYVNDPAFGGQTPALATANTGGLAVPELSLHQFIDFADPFEESVYTIDLPNGLPGLQFTMFDIDYAANDFADRVTVTGSYKGNPVTPILTNGVANYVVGNTAVGDAGSDGTSSDGNVVITFDQPVDQVVMVYGNASTAPANPDGQAASIHDFTYCLPTTSLSVLKTSAVFSDPVNNTSDPKAIPRAIMEYNILVSNNGVSDTDTESVFVTDTVPPETKLCLSDLDGAGSGPIRFNDGSPSSLLAYNYLGLTDLTDDLEFSEDNGASWLYEPVLDGDGCDPAITDFRVRPSGAFSGGGAFGLNARFMIL
jgi:uncharacterized repeat protein (TIGR01451 family)